MDSRFESHLLISGRLQIAMLEAALSYNQIETRLDVRYAVSCLTQKRATYACFELRSNQMQTCAHDHVKVCTHSLRPLDQ